MPTSVWWGWFHVQSPSSSRSLASWNLAPQQWNCSNWRSTWKTHGLTAICGRQQRGVCTANRWTWTTMLKVGIIDWTAGHITVDWTWRAYLLFSLLKHEADIVAINVKLLSDRKVRKCQRKSTVCVQAKLNKYWMEYQTTAHEVSSIKQKNKW